mmetsp:Transcript_946/g.2722  ORF Transcript_946/g.2722 Transcript_946/m.2722 type:complete len:210 (+) Transcript_946:2122-2751(+)
MPARRAASEHSSEFPLQRFTLAPLCLTVVVGVRVDLEEANQRIKFAHVVLQRRPAHAPLVVRVQGVHRLCGICSAALDFVGLVQNDARPMDAVQDGSRQIHVDVRDKLLRNVPEEAARRFVVGGAGRAKPVPFGFIREAKTLHVERPGTIVAQQKLPLTRTDGAKVFIVLELAGLNIFFFHACHAGATHAICFQCLTLHRDGIMIVFTF